MISLVGTNSPGSGFFSGVMNEAGLDTFDSVLYPLASFFLTTLYNVFGFKPVNTPDCCQVSPLSILNVSSISPLNVTESILKSNIVGASGVSHCLYISTIHSSVTPVSALVTVTISLPLFLTVNRPLSSIEPISVLSILQNTSLITACSGNIVTSNCKVSDCLSSISITVVCLSNSTDST